MGGQLYEFVGGVGDGLREDGGFWELWELVR